ncbi:MAG: histidinol dehydrogenase, partial [Mycobacteriaceae bacterium]
MLARIDLRGRIPSTAELRTTLPRGEVDVDAVLHTVRPIVDAVRERGVDAVLELSETFDKVRPRSVRVPVEEISRALENLDPTVRAALEESIARAARVHADQRRSETVTKVVEGGTVTERWVPVDRVGLYVPGGNAVLASSVVMNV